MDRVLIGVGGSGQDVVHAYLRILALTNVQPDHVPNVFIVDADAKEEASAPDGDALRCSQIKSLHNQLKAPLAAADRPVFELIKPYFQNSHDDSPRTAAENLQVEKCAPELVDIFLTDDSDAGDKEGLGI